MTNDIKSTIIKLYQKNGYYERYGVDVIISFIIIFSFMLCITYFYIMNHLPILKKNWPNNKCNPIYMPFAGYVINDKTRSKMDIASDNFNSCVQNILVSISNNAFAPINYVFNTINNSISNLTTASNSVRGMFNNVRTNVGETASNISGRTLNFTIPILSQTINNRDSMYKTHGVFTLVLYQFFGLFITTFSFFLFLKDVIIGLLILLAAAIIALWALSLVPFVGWISAAAATASTIGYVAIFIPLLIVIILISTVFGHVGGRSPPPVPGP